MPYTERSAANLVREGVERNRIFVTGNPIREVLDHYAARSTPRPPRPTWGSSRTTTCW